MSFDAMFICYKLLVMCVYICINESVVLFETKVLPEYTQIVTRIPSIHVTRKVR